MLIIFRVSPGLEHTIGLMSLVPNPVTSVLFPDPMSQAETSKFNPGFYPLTPIPVLTLETPDL